MKRFRRLGGAAVALLVAVTTAAPAAAAEEAVIGEVLEILRERGIVDEARYNELVSKNQKYEAQNQGLLGKIRFSGDFRGRLENFWYDEDGLGVERDNRTRLRYRLRVQGEADVNDYVTAVFRLASGENDLRSTNRTLGRDDDFGPDDIFIDRAFVQLRAPGTWVGENDLALEIGKVPNPFLWKNGKDYLLWDSDINPEGVSLQFGREITSGASVFANAGYYILKENSRAVDPHVLGVQGGVVLQPADDWELGGRLSWYNWSSLDPAFFGRAASTGNLLDGLSEGAPSRGNGGISAGELAAYLRFAGVPDWPILVYGHLARNFDAENSWLFPTAGGEEDTGWGVGLEVGDKKKYVMLGVGYYHMEANFWPSQFIDSDLSDGFTNRTAWTLYGARQILPNTELNVTLFWSDELDSTLPGFATSVSDAERIRLQTDLVVKF